jgi:hypothetical protein
VYPQGFFQALPNHYLWASIIRVLTLLSSEKFLQLNLFL